MSDRAVHIEVLVADSPEDAPTVDPDSRVDVSVKDQMFPTARLADGRYVAWWFQPSAPPADSRSTTEWVAAPTRYLAAATLRELWEDPTTFTSLVETSSP
ncbi:hypothetical protein [Haladaptatus sp. NG-SE-30]